jgi:pimeloyl-ACP methyl ester carboxylesterase
LKLKIAILGLLGLAIAGYLGLCGYLYAQQRRMVFQPSGHILGDPPAGSGYVPLLIDVPKLGVIEDWWAPPASGRLPTIVFFHGNATDRSDFLNQGDLFRRRGWGVVLASYRGYSGNPGQPTESGFMDDARATMATVKPRVGPVIVWGHSLGSGVAARMAAEGRAAGLVLEAPYTSITDVAAARYPYMPVRWLMLDRFDTASILDRIKVPVLIFHSTDDQTIPFAMGEALARRFGARASFVRMQGLGHFPHHQDLSATVADWARRRGIGG